MGPSLLDLSRELRDLIWDFCLTTPKPQPSPSPWHPRRNPDDDGGGGRYFFCTNEDENMIGYPGGGPHIDSLPLLLTNRQINAEVHEAIARLYSQRRMNCELNLTVHREQQLYLDWTCLPVNSLHYDTWKINFYLAGKPAWHVNRRTTNDGYCASGYSWDEPEQSMMEIFYPDHYPRIIWCYFYILQRFLERGPGFRSCPEFHITQEPPRTRSIRHFLINMCSHPPPGSPDCSELESEPYRHVEDVCQPRSKPTEYDDWQKFYCGMIDPQCAAEQMRMLVSEWLFSGRLRAQTRMAFESIERIDVALDGELMRGASWNIRNLTGRQYAAPPEHRLSVFEHNTKMPVEKIYGSLIDPEVLKKREEKHQMKNEAKRKLPEFLEGDEHAAAALDEGAVRAARGRIPLPRAKQ